MNDKLTVQELNDSVLEAVNGGTGSTETKALIVNCDLADMMDSPTGGSLIMNIGCGSKVTFHEWEGDWGHVTCRSVTGYIHRDYLKLL